ncbi:MAG TPA: toll/interleukin-1 receptor domain-containing protein, partial [Caulobacteraceae bacterium]|nr:toll/interleukin-1 receptor domain-containing protein [Caulobacteraceae bacterium]
MKGRQSRFASQALGPAALRKLSWRTWDGGGAMSGVFLSYSRADRDLAERIVKGLRGLGADVWWDEDMPGVDWREELERQINELSAVLVIWTPSSSQSKNVMSEARLGDRKDKLVNVVWGVPAPPPPFDIINALPLEGWNGRDTHHGWVRVVRTVEDCLARSGGVQRGELTDALAEHEASIRKNEDDLAAATDAFQAAQQAERAAESDATAAAQA